MSEEQQPSQTAQTSQATPNTLTDKYKAKGAQQLTLKEYEVLKAKKDQQAQKKVNPIVKIILSIPMLIIFAFGLVLIPFIFFQFFAQ